MKDWMDKTINIVRGNDFKLKVKVSLRNPTTGAYIDYDLSGATDVRLNLVSPISRIELSPEVEADDNTISGWVDGRRMYNSLYDVELMYIKDGLLRRACKKHVIRVVEADDEANYRTVMDLADNPEILLGVVLVYESLTFGSPGPPGHTPEKGVDYFTESEKAEMVEGLKDNLDGLYVEKEAGKGLSTNDYTDEEKLKLSTAKTDIAVLSNSLFRTDDNLGVYSFTFADTVAGGNKTKRMFYPLYLKPGENFRVKLSGTSAAPRIIIRTNSGSGTTLKDNAALERWYSFTAAEEIRSIWLWYNGDVDLTCELHRGRVATFPLTDAPDYIVRTMAYKPLGHLSKGYICFYADDGRTGLATYTIPMITAKGIPITFALMQNSEVFQTPEHRQLVLGAVSNHGCSVAQHGNTIWTNYTEHGLYEFFLREKAFFTALGIEVKGAVIPAHITTYMIEAIAGGMYGVVRCGYNGLNPDATPNYHTIWNRDKSQAYSVARSNMYCLSSMNVRDMSFNNWKAAIDYVIEHGGLLNCYFHDNDFLETAEDYQARRYLLEGVLDYAKSSGVNIIQLGDIISRLCE